MGNPAQVVELVQFLWTLGGSNEPNLQVVRTCQREGIATTRLTYLTNTLATDPGDLGTPCGSGGVRHPVTGCDLITYQTSDQYATTTVPTTSIDFVCGVFPTQQQRRRRLAQGQLLQLGLEEARLVVVDSKTSFGDKQKPLSHMPLKWRKHVGKPQVSWTSRVPSLQTIYENPAV